MLIQFNFKNHKSFYNKSCIDMCATSEERHSEDLIDINGVKMLPYLMIYGANASGKSTVIDAFYFMAYAVIRSFDLDVNERFPVVPFLFSQETQKEPSKFEVFINIDENEYRYGFTATPKGIQEEWFYKKLFSKNSRVKEKLIFEREKNDIRYANEFSMYEEYSNLINEKMLVLSFLGRKKIDEFGKLYEWFYNSKYINENTFLTVQKSRELLYQEKEIREKFDSILSKIDPCLKKIEIKKKIDENQIKSYEIYGVHKSTEDEDVVYKLPIQGESAGTRKIINILPLIIRNVILGGILFIDELDIQLHPLLLKKIINMYTDKSINKNNAQLIFTAHNTILFQSKFTRRDQIMLVEKDSNGKSSLYSLSDFKNLRCDADYEKKYFSGNFGAVPFNED